MVPIRAPGWAFRRAARLAALARPVPRPRALPPGSRGFTLIEVLVALSIMALLALMSWRGLDAMLRAAQTSRDNGRVLQGLQDGLAQWHADLDRLVETPYTHAVDWDGRVLRVLRGSAVGSREALHVVAWTQRQAGGVSQWVRWQSPPLRQRAALLQAWQQAAAWARDSADSDSPEAIAIVPLASWQLLYYRGGQWVPAETLLGNRPRGTGPATPPAMPASSGSFGDTPEGLRLVLNLPAGGPLTGRLSSDWFNPLSGAAR